MDGRCDGCTRPTCIGCKLIESRPFYTELTEMKLEEGKTLRKGVIMRARGKFGHAGRITENGRMYRRAHVEREIERLSGVRGAMKMRGMIGEADHPGPAAGGPSVTRSALIQTGLGINDDGEVMGEIEVVDTRVGKDLAALIRAGVQVGFSSRARGTTTRKKMTSEDPDYALNQEWDGKDFEEVNDDLYLVAYDAVIGPAVEDAHVGDFQEQKTEEVSNMIKLEDVLKNEDLMKQIAESDSIKKVVEAAVKAAREEVEKEWAEKILPAVKEHMNTDEFFDAHFEEVDAGADNTEAAVKCAECDSAVPKGSKFCPSCGVKVATKPPKEQTQDEKDKVIAELKKRLDALEASNKKKDEKLEGMDKRDKDKETEAVVDAFVAERLKGEVAVVVEGVNADVEELRERGEKLKDEKAAKEFVEARIERYKKLNEVSGGKLFEAKSRSTNVVPGDADEAKKVEEKKKEKVDALLDSVD